MKNFDLSLDEEISIYVKTGLTPTELFILRLLFLAIDGDTSYLVKYVSDISNGKILLKQVLISLKEKNVINSTFKIPEDGESLNFQKIPINKNFLKNYLKESHYIGKEFFDAYPSFITIHNKVVSIKNFTKAGLFSFEDFCIYYAKNIKNSGITHERIMELLEAAKQGNLINYSIIEFIASRKWLEIEYILNSGDINGYQNSELI